MPPEFEWKQTCFQKLAGPTCLLKLWSVQRIRPTQIQFQLFKISVLVALVALVSKVNSQGTVEHCSLCSSEKSSLCSKDPPCYGVFLWFAHPVSSKDDVRCWMIIHFYSFKVFNVSAIAYRNEVLRCRCMNAYSYLHYRTYNEQRLGTLDTSVKAITKSLANTFSFSSLPLIWKLLWSYDCP